MTNGCLLEHNDVRESAIFHSILSLSLSCVQPQTLGRVHSLVSFGVAFSLIESAEFVLGPWSWYGFRLPPSWAGYKYGARSLLSKRAFSCCSRGKGSVVTWERSQKTLMGVPLLVLAVKEDGSIFACLSLCLCLFICSRSAVSQVVLAECPTRCCCFLVRCRPLRPELA